MDTTQCEITLQRTSDWHRFHGIYNDASALRGATYLPSSLAAFSFSIVHSSLHASFTFMQFGNLDHIYPRKTYVLKLYGPVILHMMGCWGNQDRFKALGHWRRSLAGNCVMLQWGEDPSHPATNLIYTGIRAMEPATYRMKPPKTDKIKKILQKYPTLGILM